MFLHKLPSTASRLFKAAARRRREHEKRFFAPFGRSHRPMSPFGPGDPASPGRDGLRENDVQMKQNCPPVPWAGSVSMRKLGGENTLSVGLFAFFLNQ